LTLFRPSTPEEPPVTTQPLQLPDQAVAVAELVAREFSRHRDHVRRRFAQDAAAALEELRQPNDGDERVAVFNRAVEACIRIVRRLADLPADDPPTTRGAA